MHQPILATRAVTSEDLRFTSSGHAAARGLPSALARTSFRTAMLAEANFQRVEAAGADFSKAQLNIAHVAALRIYTTHLFKYLNGPLRDKSYGFCKKPQCVHPPRSNHHPPGRRAEHCAQSTPLVTVACVCAARCQSL